MGEIKKIWVKRFKGGPMDRVDSVRMDQETGVDGNADTSRKRQVTVVSVDGWAAAAAEVGDDVDPIVRRANVLVQGVDLVESRGKTLRLGDVEILLWGETRPCRQMEEACEGLLAALDPEWRGGAHGEIVRGGEVRQGDSASLLPVAR